MFWRNWDQHQRFWSIWGSERVHRYRGGTYSRWFHTKAGDPFTVDQNLDDFLRFFFSTKVWDFVLLCRTSGRCWTFFWWKSGGVSKVLSLYSPKLLIRKFVPTLAPNVDITCCFTYTLDILGLTFLPLTKRGCLKWKEHLYFTYIYYISISWNLRKFPYELRQEAKQWMSRSESPRASVSNLQWHLRRETDIWQPGIYRRVVSVTHTDIHTYIHTYLHTYIPTYLPTYMHTYIHTCIHTYVR